MSRVAKSPIELPSEVTLDVKKSNIKVKGKKGELELNLHESVIIEKSKESDNVYHVKPRTNAKSDWAQAGTARALVSNMIEGVSNGFVKELEINGVGYRAQVQGKKINLTLGKSHPEEYILPEGITAEAPTQTTLKIMGVDKQRVGQVAAEIRDLRKPEPYKGKGIKYKNEHIVRKEAKKK